MAYAVDYVPTYRRGMKNTRPKNTRPSQNRGKCKITVKDLKRQVRWNLDKLATEYAANKTIPVDAFISVLRLDRIVTGYDRKQGGENAMLMLCHEAGLERHRSEATGVRYLNAAETIERLNEWMGIK